MKNNQLYKYAAIAVGIILVIMTIADSIRKSQPEPAPEEPVSQSSPEAAPEPKPEPPSPDYPVGKFGPDDLRLEYVSGEMTLRIPKIEFEGPVYSGEEDITEGSDTYQSVSDAVLEKGVGLFGAAQVPTASNSNVSIAGHRDLHGMEFYNIDKMEIGDNIYLEFRGWEYVYEVEDIFETTPTDWEAVRIKEYGCVTLQSCTPLYVASHRIFVVGRLISINDLPA